MKKLIFAFVFALLGTYFQSAQAQTFSRVVTVTLDTTVSNGLGLNKVLYTVPLGKILKVSGIIIDSYYTNASNKYTLPAEIAVNSVTIGSTTNFRITDFWIKPGDTINLKGVLSGYNQQSSYIYKVFLSGIEYDAQ
jgi:hypothetical protein